MCLTHKATMNLFQKHIQEYYIAYEKTQYTTSTDNELRNAFHEANSHYNTLLELELTMAKNEYLCKECERFKTTRQQKFKELRSCAKSHLIESAQDVINKRRYEEWKKMCDEFYDLTKKFNEAQKKSTNFLCNDDEFPKFVSAYHDVDKYYEMLENMNNYICKIEDDNDYLKLFMYHRRQTFDSIKFMMSIHKEQSIEQIKKSRECLKWDKLYSKFNETIKDFMNSCHIINLYMEKQEDISIPLSATISHYKILQNINHDMSIIEENNDVCKIFGNLRKQQFDNIVICAQIYIKN